MDAEQFDENCPVEHRTTNCRCQHHPVARSALIERDGANQESGTGDVADKRKDKDIDCAQQKKPDGAGQVGILVIISACCGHRASSSEEYGTCNQKDTKN